MPCAASRWWACHWPRLVGSAVSCVVMHGHGDATGRKADVHWPVTRWAVDAGGRLHRDVMWDVMWGVMWGGSERRKPDRCAVGHAVGPAKPDRCAVR